MRLTRAYSLVTRFFSRAHLISLCAEQVHRRGGVQGDGDGMAAACHLHRFLAWDRCGKHAPLFEIAAS